MAPRRWPARRPPDRAAPTRSRSTFNNGVAGPVTQNFTLTVQQPPLFTSANSTTFTVGTPGTFTLTASGVPGGDHHQHGRYAANRCDLHVGDARARRNRDADRSVPAAVHGDQRRDAGCDAELHAHRRCPAITVNPSTLPDGLFNTAYGPVTFTQTGSTGSSFTWSATGLPTGICHCADDRHRVRHADQHGVQCRRSPSPSPTTSAARACGTRRSPSGRWRATTRSVTPSATRNWRSERWAPCRRRRLPC